MLNRITFGWWVVIFIIIGFLTLGATLAYTGKIGLTVIVTAAVVASLWFALENEWSGGVVALLLVGAIGLGVYFSNLAADTGYIQPRLAEVPGTLRLNFASFIAGQDVSVDRQDEPESDPAAVTVVTATPFPTPTPTAQPDANVQEGADADAPDMGVSGNTPNEEALLVGALDLPGDVFLWPGTFPVVETITRNEEWAQPDFIIPWAPHVEIDREKCQYLDDIDVWCTFESRPGAFLVYTATGISTPAGTFTGCNGGWLYNDTDHQVSFKIQYAEAVDVAQVDDSTPLDVSTISRQLHLRVVSTNSCGGSSHLGFVPLYPGQVQPTMPWTEQNQ